MRALTLLLIALALVSAPAAAAPPPDLSADPLDRATLLALPSVYRVTVTLDVPALVTADGERVTLTGRARRVVESGTAFGVAPGGWLATARHVVAPDDTSLARIAYQARLIQDGQAHSDEVARAWVERTGARPVGDRVVSIEIAQADAGEGARRSRTYRPIGTPVTSETADLALVRIDAPGAPGLPLDEAASTGTPVVTVGFGRGSALEGGTDELGRLEPAVRRGELSRTGTLEGSDMPRQAIAISVPVQSGDSGAPVLDGAGAVRGVVIQRTEGGGIAERATELRQLMETADVTPGTGRAADEFREGLEALWRLDTAAAQAAFGDALAAFPDHTLAGRESDRAAALAAAEFRLAGDRWPQGLLMGIGVLAGVVALGFAAALTLPMRGRRPPAPGR